MLVILFLAFILCTARCGDDSFICQITDHTKGIETLISYPCRTNNSYVLGNSLSQYPWEENKNWWNLLVGVIAAVVAAGLLVFFAWLFVKCKYYEKIRRDRDKQNLNEIVTLVGGGEKGKPTASSHASMSAVPARRG